jgi:thiol-disulfide isomerase/thioredoxin
VVGGLIVLVVVLAAASAAGWGVKLRKGRFSAPGSMSLTEADLGVALGERATLVQFSTEFCAYCGPTRELLAEVASSRDGVALVEIDAARRLDLARRLNVLSTPTILVLGPDGSIARRASGQPRKSDVLAAVSSVLDAALGEVKSDSGAAGE